MTFDVVTLRDATATDGGVLGLASPFPAGTEWTRGIAGLGTGACLDAGTHLFCYAASPASPASPGESVKVFQSLDAFDFTPAAVEVSVICSNLGITDEAVGRARAAAAVRAEMVAGVELATGASTGNPSLADAVAIGTNPTMAGALAALEAAIATTLAGHAAWVHVAPSDLVLLAAADAVWRDIGGWRTPGGHTVVSSPGYQASQAGVLVATTEVFAAVGDVAGRDTQDRRLNRRMATFEAPVLAAFDPCFNVSVSVPGSFESEASPTEPPL